MGAGTVGLAVMGGDSNAVLARIEDSEERGIDAAWLTVGGASLDGITLMAAAGARTERILLGTCIVPTWGRHPVAAAQQVQVAAQLSGGRFRFGIGPSHVRAMTTVFGADYRTPLTALREYLTITRTLLHTGAVEFEGRMYRANVSLPAPVPGVQVMASALRPKSYELCGEVADGAISWVSPGVYLRDVALPAMHRGADRAGRACPPLIAHAPVCVHDDPDDVRAAAREQLANYPRLPFYQAMFAEAGFPEAAADEGWSDAMIEAVVLSGNEERVAGRIAELFDFGASEIIVSIVAAGSDAAASRERTLALLADLARSS
ncbi:MAG: LLM class flavin-dependent oxidoreductase [Chloroflexota bacterium]|nr:LLM class flavin-dependent oxidoreductase [Chloroflexota bacterium]MDE2886380.1 LLM class flavin-dependent oxidoreductase [Chloroflexota bacterium]